jgi:hypothetical protein
MMIAFEIGDRVRVKDQHRGRGDRHRPEGLVTIADNGAETMEMS